MPRGEKSAYTDKQKRQAEHIEESEIEEGRSREDAERIAWATVNKLYGGGKKSGSGRKTTKKSSTKTAKKSGG
jgi:plasmid stabilization system protein ParE